MGTASDSPRDYYNVLGVAQNASEEQIKKAFREKALVLHPDQSGRGADAFHELQEAYGVLRDPSKRRQYDAMLRGGWSDAGIGGEHFGGPWGQPGVDSRDFDAAFDAWFKRTMEHMKDWEEERVGAERRAAERRARAAAWELEKEEAKATRVRAERLRRRTEDARAARHAGILRTFWQTHHGLTRMDAALVALVLASAAGLSLVWRSRLRSAGDGAAGHEAAELARGQAAAAAAAELARGQAAVAELARGRAATAVAAAGAPAATVDS